MTACAKHAAQPVKGYCACPGCEVENLRIERDTLRQGYQSACFRVLDYELVIQAARKLVKSKGRFHTERNYKALVDALAKLEDDRPAAQGAAAQGTAAQEGQP